MRERAARSDFIATHAGQMPGWQGLASDRIFADFATPVRD